MRQSGFEFAFQQRSSPRTVYLFAARAYSNVADQYNLDCRQKVDSFWYQIPYPFVNRFSTFLCRHLFK